MTFINRCRIFTDRLTSGMVLAQPVISGRGIVLLEPGMVLTDKVIADLKSWGILHVDIQREETDAGTGAGAEFVATYQTTLNSVAAAFEKVRKFKEVPIAECRELVENQISLMVDVSGVLDTLHRIKSHHENTFQHSLNIAILSGILGKWIGFQGLKLKDIILAGLLHDIGKVVIPAEVLNKRDALTISEAEVIRRHPDEGYKLLLPMPEMAEEVRLGVLQHHEREDGSGYPLGLRRDTIHLFAKIIAVADLYEHLSSAEGEKAGAPPLAAMENILVQMYDKLDPVICWTFSDNLSKYFIGMPVRLSDGRTAKIVMMNQALSRPVVQTGEGCLVDLSAQRELEIVSMLN